MRIREIADILKAKVLTETEEEQLDIDINVGCGSDLMSDVLAYVIKENGILLTGLVNPQVVRTADMLDMRCIAFVRGKIPDDDMIELATERGIVLISTEYRLFTACGLLFSNGLDGESDL